MPDARVSPTARCRRRDCRTSRGADDRRRALRQRSAGARARTATTARCRCTARSTTSARSLNLAFDLSESMTLKSITAYRDIRLDRRARRRQHAAHDPAHRVRRERRSVEPGAAAHSTRPIRWSASSACTTSSRPPTTSRPSISIRRRRACSATATTTTSTTTSWAAFTQWTYKFADKFALTVGGRYTEDEKGSYPDQFDYATPERQAGARAVVPRDVHVVHAVGVVRGRMDRQRDDLRELFGRLQGRRLEQPLQCRADAGAAGGAAEVRARKRRRPSSSARSSISPTTRCA